MDMTTQFMIVFFVGIIIAIFISLMLYEKNKKNGKKLKHIGFKVGGVIGVIAFSIPILLSDISVTGKLVVIAIMILGCFAYACSLISARRSLRKIRGLPSEDE